MAKLVKAQDFDSFIPGSSPGTSANSEVQMPI